MPLGSPSWVAFHCKQRCEVGVKKCWHSEPPWKQCLIITLKAINSLSPLLWSMDDAIHWVNANVKEECKASILLPSEGSPSRYNPPDRDERGRDGPLNVSHFHPSILLYFTYNLCNRITTNWGKWMDCSRKIDADIDRSHHSFILVMCYFSVLTVVFEDRMTLVKDCWRNSLCQAKCLFLISVGQQVQARGCVL